MSRWFYLTAIIVLPLVKLDYARHSLHRFIPVIVNTSLYQQTATVFFSHAGELDEDLGMSTELHDLTLALSRRGIATLHIHFRKLWRTSVYYDRIVRPKFVIFLTGRKSIAAFSRATRDLDMNFPIWLVIFLQKPEAGERDHCREPRGNIFNVNFDTTMYTLCDNDTIIREWYSLNDDRTEIMDVAVWQSDGGVVPIANETALKKRNDMGGVVLRAVLVESSYLVRMNNGVLSGKFAELLLELGRAANFSLEVVKRAAHHGWTENGTNRWNGAIGYLVDGDADIALGEYSMSPDRLDAVDFTVPIIVVRKSLVIKKPHGFGGRWFAHFQALSTEIWTFVACLIIGSPFLLCATRVGKEDGTVSQQYLDNYIRVWGIYCQQGLSVSLERSSEKLAYFALFLSALIMSAAHSAALISLLTVRIHPLPFASLEEFVADGSYKLLCFRTSANYGRFLNAPDPVGRKAMKLMEAESKLPKTFLDGFQQVCNEDKVALYTSVAAMNLIYHKVPCKLTGIDMRGVESYSVILSKNNPYTKLLSGYLQRFYSSGALNRISKSRIIEDSCDDCKDEPIGLRNVALLFLIWASGALLSASVLLMERFRFARTRSSRLRSFSR